jgi:1-acyl-sn-glycerol-3-phosphate acyltransferase
VPGRTTHDEQEVSEMAKVRSGRKLGFWYLVAVGLLRPWLLLLTKRDWHGAENLRAEILPDGGQAPIVVCPNHISWFDPLESAHFLYDNGRPPRFLGKESVFRVPIAGRIITGAGQIPVYRETADAGKAFSAAVAAVRAGECVAIFPEATLTRDPQLWPMIGKTGAARIALTTGCPVIPIAQWGAQDILAPYGRRLHLLPRRTVRVWAGPPVDLSQFAGSPLDAATLRGATDAILERITVMLAQMRAEQPPEHRWDPRQHGQPRIGDFHRDPGGAG